MTIDQENGLLNFLFSTEDEPEVKQKKTAKSKKKQAAPVAKTVDTEKDSDSKTSESLLNIVTEDSSSALALEAEAKAEAEKSTSNSPLDAESADIALNEEALYQQILALQAFIKEQNIKYYQQSAPEISDLEYDRKKAQLAKLEAEHADLIQTNAGEFVTKEVGSDLSDNLVATTKMSVAELEENNLIVQRYLGIEPEQVDVIYEQYKKQIVHHDRLMLSLANVYEAKEFAEFYDSVVKSLQEQDLYKTKKDLELCAEPKFDGIAVSLVYRNCELEVAVTRGDGSKGYEITQLVKRIANIPQQVTSLLEQYQASDHTSVLEVRGELILLRQDFEELNEAYEAEGKKKLVNLRNGAGSFVSRAPYARKLVRQKGTGKVDLYIIDNLPKQVPLRLFAYSINQYVIDGEDILAQKTSHYDLLQELKGYGFPVSDLVTKVSTLKDCENFYQRIAKMRAELGFDIDGTVFKVNNLEQQNAIGWNAESPRWAKAYKFTPEESVSQLENVILSVSRTGSITPVAKIDKVEVSGVQVSSVNLYNYFQLKRLDLHQQDKVVVYRGGEVIPVLKEALSDKRQANAEAVEVLPLCPGCGSVLYERSVLTEKLVAREAVTSLLTAEAAVSAEVSAMDNSTSVTDNSVSTDPTSAPSETEATKAGLVVASAGPQGNLFCSNHKHCCNGQLASQIEFFYSKNGYEAKGLGKEIVARFVNLGLFKHWSEVPLLSRPEFIEFADKKVRFMLAQQLSYKQAYNLQLQQLAYYQLQLQAKLEQEFQGIPSLEAIEQQIIYSISLDQFQTAQSKDKAPAETVPDKVELELSLEEDESNRHKQQLIALARQLGQGYRNWAKQYLLTQGVDPEVAEQNQELLTHWLFQQQAQQDFLAQAKQLKGIFLNYSAAEQEHKLLHLFQGQEPDLTWQEILSLLPVSKTDLQSCLYAFATLNKFASTLQINSDYNLSKVYELYKQEAESFRLAEELWLRQWYNLNGFINASLVEQLKTSLVEFLSQDLIADPETAISGDTKETTQSTSLTSSNYISLLAKVMQANKVAEFKQRLASDSRNLVAEAFAFTVKKITLNLLDLLRKVGNFAQARELAQQTKVFSEDFAVELAWLAITASKFAGINPQAKTLSACFKPLRLTTDLVGREGYFFDQINQQLIERLLALIITELKTDLEANQLSYYKVTSQGLEQELDFAQVFAKSATADLSKKRNSKEAVLDLEYPEITDPASLSLTKTCQLVKEQLALSDLTVTESSLVAINQELASKAEALLAQGKNLPLSSNLFSAVILNQFLVPRLAVTSAEQLLAKQDFATPTPIELRVETLNQKVLSLKELKTIGKEQKTLAEHLERIFAFDVEDCDQNQKFFKQAEQPTRASSLETANPEVSYDLVAPNFTLDAQRQQQLDSYFESLFADPTLTNAANLNSALILAQGGKLDFSYHSAEVESELATQDSVDLTADSQSPTELVAEVQPETDSVKETESVSTDSTEGEGREYHSEISEKAHDFTAVSEPYLLNSESVAPANAESSQILTASQLLTLALEQRNPALQVLEVYRQNTSLLQNFVNLPGVKEYSLDMVQLFDLPTGYVRFSDKVELDRINPAPSLDEFIAKATPVLELDSCSKLSKELYFRSNFAQLANTVAKQQQEHKMTASIFNYALDQFRAEVNVRGWKFDSFFDRISTAKLKQVLAELEQQVTNGKFEEFISSGDKNLIKLNLTSRSRLVALILDYLSNLESCLQQDTLDQALAKLNLSLNQERLKTYLGLLAADRLTRWYELNLELKPFLSKFKKKASKNDSLENLAFNWQALTEFKPELSKEQQKQAVLAGIFTAYNSEKLAAEAQDLEATYNFEKTSLFKEKNLATLASFFADNKEIPLDLLYNALGIEGVGATRVNAFLAESMYPNVESLIDFDRSRIDRLIALRSAGKAEREQAENKELLKLIYGLGDIILESFANYFSDERVQQGLKSLVAQGYSFVNPLNKPNKYHNKFNLANVVVTGTLAGIKRDQIADFVKESGGVFKSSVTKDSNYLIIAGTFDPNAKLSTKLKKAVDSGVEIIDEPSFREIYNSCRQQTGEELLP